MIGIPPNRSRRCAKAASQALAAATIALAAIAGCHPPAETAPDIATIAQLAGPDIAERIATMPFLVTPEHGADRPALTSMSRLAQRDPDLVSALLEHPSIPTTGITDETTWRIAPYHRLIRADPEVAHAVLDPEQWNLSVAETRLRGGEKAAIGILSPSGAVYTADHQTVQRALHKGHETYGQLPEPYLEPCPF